jgi:hypothetical protein
MRSKRCGNCQHFVRIKGWGRWRNGLCDKLDFNLKADSSYAQSCKLYKGKRHSRPARLKAHELDVAALFLALAMVVTGLVSPARAIPMDYVAPKPISLELLP